MGDNDDEAANDYYVAAAYYVSPVTFDQYEVTSVNPGGYLLLFTGLFCVLCFLVGSCATHGKILYPLARKFQRVYQGFFAKLHAFRDRGDDDCFEMSGFVDGEEMAAYQTMTDGGKKDFKMGEASSAYQNLDVKRSGDSREVNDKSSLPTREREVVRTEEKVYRQVLGRDGWRARQANSMRNIEDDDEIELSIGDFFNPDWLSTAPTPAEAIESTVEESTDNSNRAWEETRKILKLGTP